MSFLLDTNVVSELRKPESHADPAVRAWTRSQPASSLFVSVITIMELEIGVRRVERRDRARGVRLRAWLDQHVLTAFAGRVLDIDVDVARRAAAMHVPDPCSGRDALIAATAVVNGLTVATRNTRDFAATGARLVDPWVAAR